MAESDQHCVLAPISQCDLELGYKCLLENIPFVSVTNMLHKLFLTCLYKAVSTVI